MVKAVLCSFKLNACRYTLDTQTQATCRVKPRSAARNVVVRKLIELIPIRSTVTIIGKVASRMFLREYVN